jgi:GNAT superfamily N-acetyltransferase
MANLSITVIPSAQLVASPQLSTYVDFINACFGTGHKRFHCFEAARFVDLGSFRSEFSHPGCVLAVARDPKAGEIVAAGGYKPNDDGSVDLKCLSTAEHLEGTGIGTYMNTYIENLARDQGFTKINAVVVKEHGDLLGFYERRGYKSVRHERLDVGSPEVGGKNIVEIVLVHTQKDL